MMRDDLIVAVSRAANLSMDQAQEAVVAMLRFISAKLPSTLVGQLHTHLDLPSSTDDDAMP